MQIIFAKANWEVGALPVAEFCQRVAAAGFAATDVYLPALRESPSEIRAAHRVAGLALIGHIATEGATPEAHAESLQIRYLHAIECEPLFVNSHTGKDHFAPADNQRIFELGQELAQRHGIPLRHETHRGRALFSAPAAHAFLQALPALALTADFSHWVCVHESDLSDQPAALAAALTSARHIHARVGFDQGPQISDPRNPAHAVWVERFLGWWLQIVQLRLAAGDAQLTITPEFGPPPYMPLQGASPFPVGDAWECNCWMLDLLSRRLNAFR